VETVDAIISSQIIFGDGHDRMIAGFITTYMQVVPTPTKVVSSNPAHGEVYSIQHYVICQFVSDLLQVVGFSGYSGFLHQ
jgi:hypothetical protein